MGFQQKDGSPFFFPLAEKESMSPAGGEKGERKPLLHYIGVATPCFLLLPKLNLGI
jgi:hypothetical protein